MPSQNRSEELRGSSSVTPGISSDDCSACGWPLRGALYCRKCGPPEPPPPSSDNLSSGKTFACIALIVLSFAAVAVMKLDIKVNLFATQSLQRSVIVPDEEISQDKDFQVVQMVNISLANMRKWPSQKSVIVMVLKKDTRVKVLEEKGEWLHISVHGKTGWIHNKLITAQVK